MENIILVKNEYEIPMRHAKNTPMAWVLRCKHPWWSPTPTRMLLRLGTMLQVFYFVFACVKRSFCVRKLPFLLTRYFFTQDAKYPFYLRKI